MKKYKTYIFCISITILITPFAIYAGYHKRGHLTLGGEWLIPICGWIIATWIVEIKKHSSVDAE